MTNYVLNFVNNSSNTGSCCVYQQPPQEVPDMFSLAWFAEVAAPSTELEFTWAIDYSFVWSETGTLQAGVQFVASQNWACSPSDQNMVTFTDANGVPTFSNLTTGASPGSLQISTDSTIPAGTFSVGIGMSNSGTYVVQAQPNWDVLFTPTPEYWVVFGSYTQGEVLSITSSSQTAQVVFPDNVYEMWAILNANNTWTISSTPPANQ